MKKIEILKKQIIESKDIHIPVDYFFDLIEGIRDLPAEGHVLIKEIDLYPVLSLILQIVAQKIAEFFNNPIKILDAKIFAVEAEHFYHGSLSIQEIPVPVLILYCSDLHIGIISFSDINDKTHINYVRFSIQLPQGNKTIH